jgi:hypothetical protein
MTDFLGYGKEKRRAGNLEILSGRVTFRYAAVAVSCSVQSAAPYSQLTPSFGHLPYRDAFQEMLESVNKNGHTFEECKKALKDSTHSRSHASRITISEGHPADIKLDSGFKEFFGYCKSQGIPVIIVSRYSTVYSYSIFIW